MIIPSLTFYQHFQGKLIKLYSRQLVTKAKLREDVNSPEMKHIPSLKQWLQVVGLNPDSIRVRMLSSAFPAYLFELMRSNSLASYFWVHEKEIDCISCKKSPRISLFHAIVMNITRKHLQSNRIWRQVILQYNKKILAAKQNKRICEPRKNVLFKMCHAVEFKMLNTCYSPLGPAFTSFTYPSITSSELSPKLGHNTSKFKAQSQPT